tara:strand:- start:13 stop:258 length:246 start_codon:yes stop_codon:yes gene_type:complete
MLGEEKLLLVILTMLIVICFYVSSVDEKRKTINIIEMAEQERRSKRDIAITKVMDIFCKRSERDYHQKERLLVSIIEDAQR